MNTPARLAAFGLGLVAAFAAGIGIGSAVGPVGTATPAVEMPADHGGEEPAHSTAGTHEEAP